MPFRPKPKPTLEHLRLDQITWDEEVQPREGSPPQEKVEEYAQRYKEGLPMGPVEVAFDGETYWGFDGFTRRLAAPRAGLSVLPAHVYEGTREDAVRWARSANAEQRQQWTRADRQRVTRAAILDHPADLDSDLALECDAHHRTVRTARMKMAEEMLAADAGLTDGHLIATLGVRPEDLIEVRGLAAAGTPVPAARQPLVAPRPRERKAAPPAPRQDEDEPADDHSRAIDARNRRQEKRKKQDEAARKPDLFDQTGALVPEILRDLFASGALAGLVEELAALEPLAEYADKVAQAANPGKWSDRAAPLAIPYPHFEFDKFVDCLRQAKRAAQEAAGHLRHAREYARNGLPYAACTVCAGERLGKTDECVCLGGGYLPEWQYKSLNRQGA